MYPVLFFLAFRDQPLPPQPADRFPHLPAVADAKRFPPYDECNKQVERASGHIAWLARMKPCWRERAEWFDVWTRQAERDRFLWGVLRDARGDWGEEEERRWRLERYRHHVGRGRYDRGWTPPVLPADLHPEPPAAEKVPGVPRAVGMAGMNNRGW